MAMARRVAPPSTPAMDTGMMNSAELSTASYVRNHQKDPGQQKRQLTIHLVIVLLIGWSLREDVTSCTTRKRENKKKFNRYNFFVPGKYYYM